MSAKATRKREDDPMKFADHVFKSDYMFEGSSDSYFDGAVAVRGNKIVALGSYEDVEGFIGPDTQVHDCTGKLVMPGFIDPHTHLGDAAQVASPYTVNLFGTKSAEECLERLKAFREANPDEKRIYGFGWLREDWGEGAQMPTRQMLDAVVDDVPVYFQASAAHFMWANSKALEESGITRDTTFPYGYACKDENGDLTGIVMEIDAISRMVCNAHALPIDKRKEVTIPFLHILSSLGLTSISVIAGETEPVSDYVDYEAYQELDEELDGGLPVRMNLIPSMGFSGDLSKAVELRNKYNNDKVFITSVKQFVDGIPNIHTAYMYEPYRNTLESDPVQDGSWRGGSFNTQEVYNEVVTKANSLGFGVRMHTIGDAATTMAVDAYEASFEKNGLGPYRNTIEHMYYAKDEDIERMSKLDIVCSAQPSHLNIFDPIIDEFFGPERRNHMDMHRKIIDSGVTLAFGTDFPCTGLSPFETIYYAVTRCNFDGKPMSTCPEQAITVGEALKAYTSGSAQAMNRADRIGTLAPGKFADIIVLDGPMFGEDPKKILERKVELTMCDGRVVYTA